MASRVSLNIDAFKAKVRTRIDAKMIAMGEAMVQRARTLAPVDTGRLRRSIGYTYRNDTMTLTLYADASYAVFVEMGTRTTPPRPFLRPALALSSRFWGGVTGLAGGSAEVAFPNTAARYDNPTSLGKHRVAPRRS